MSKSGKVFIKVAQCLNFSKAAEELYVSQPAISKHIKELENTYKVTLFNRDKGKITLTCNGEIFYKYAIKIMETYNDLESELNSLSEDFSGELKIGASTTIAQYFISPLLAQIIRRYPNIKFKLSSGNTQFIEKALLNKEIDLGIVEGNSKLTNIKYTPFAKDELVLITSTSNKCKDTITSNQLKNLPLVLRENGSGTLQVISNALNEKNLKITDLNILLQIGSTEAIKDFLNNYPDSFAIISVISIINELKNNKLKIIDIKDLQITRNFYFISNQGYIPNKVERFIRYGLNWYSNL